MNCLSLRRPKDTILLPPRFDEIRNLDFSATERQHYIRIKDRAYKRIAEATQTRSPTDFLNALHWVNELRLLCNHGIRNPIDFQLRDQLMTAQRSWNQIAAQIIFDQLEEAGLARCSNASCGSDLASVYSHETEMQNLDDPRLDESLEMLCSFCYQERVSQADKFFPVCNHLPRCSWTQKQLNYRSEGFSSYSRNTQLPTKLMSVIEDLSRVPKGIKR